MTREEYLAAIRSTLQPLPESEINDICSDFEEHFAVGLSQGKTEHEIAAELGDPAAVAETYLDDELEDIGHTMKESAVHAAAVPAVKAPAISAGRPAEGSTRTAGTEKDLTGARLFVIFFNLLFAWWAALSVFGVIISFWGASAALMGGGIAAFAGLAAAPGAWTAVLVLLGIAGITLAIATGILNFFLSKWTVIGCRAYVKWNKKLYNEGF